MGGVNKKDDRQHSSFISSMPNMSTDKVVINRNTPPRSHRINFYHTRLHEKLCKWYDAFFMSARNCGFFTLINWLAFWPDGHQLNQSDGLKNAANGWHLQLQATGGSLDVFHATRLINGTNCNFKKKKKKNKMRVRGFISFLQNNLFSPSVPYLGHVRIGPTND